MKNKILTLLAFAICPYIVLSQDTDVLSNFENKTGNIYYQKVVDVDTSFSIQDLYSKTTDWIENNLGEEIEFLTNDKNKGELTLVSHLEPQHFIGVTNAKNHFELNIELKKGRYRHTLSKVKYEFSLGDIDYNIPDFEKWLEAGGDNPKTRENRIIFSQNLDEKFSSLLNSLKDVLSDKPW